MRVVRFESLATPAKPEPVAKPDNEQRPILVADPTSPEYQAAYAKAKQQIKEGKPV